MSRRSSRMATAISTGTLIEALLAELGDALARLSGHSEVLLAFVACESLSEEAAAWLLWPAVRRARSNARAGKR
jgi:hypothetical protein